MVNEFLEASILKSLEVLKKIQFNKKDERSRTMISLYCSILELSQSISVLVKNSSGTGITVLFRSIYEALIDFLNLINNPKYLLIMQFEDLSYQKKLREVANSANPYVVLVPEEDKMDSDKKEVEEKLEEIKQQLKMIYPGKKIKYIASISHKAKLAGLKDEYETIYRWMCSESHNDISALWDRHTMINMDQSGFIITAFKPFDLRSHLSCLIEIIRIIKAITCNLHEEFSSTVKDKVLSDKEDFEKNILPKMNRML